MATSMQLKSPAAESLWRVRLRLIRRSFGNNWSIFRESPLGIAGLIIILFYGLIALAYPILINTVWDPEIYDPKHGYDMQQSMERAAAGLDMNPAPPSAAHWLGTDPWGRDVFAQLSFSAAAEFFLGVIAALITVFIGTLVAAIAAYFGRFVDTFFMRVADVMLLFPLISFFIVLSALIEDLNLYTLAIILGIVHGFGGIAIVLKSQAMTIKVKPFVDAARISGGNNFHIILSHIIPNLLPLSFLYMMFSVTTAIFSEAVLSFFGVINVHMSWGLMVQMANIAGYLQGDWMIKTWWLFFPPSLSITALCAAFYLVGRGFDEIVNPRLRRV